MIAANTMNPPSTQSAVLRVGSSPAVCRTVFAWRGWVGVSMIRYMTTTTCKSNTTTLEILHNFVREVIYW